MKTILFFLLLVTAPIIASEASDAAKPARAAEHAAVMVDLVTLRDRLQAAYDSGKDPVDVEFPNGAVKTLARSVLVSPRDPKPGDPVNPPVGYIALINDRIIKLQRKIDKQD